MTDQLVLIDTHPAWRLDSTTRARGMRGVARAREALLEARSKLRGATDRIEGEPGDTHRTDGEPGDTHRTDGEPGNTHRTDGEPRDTDELAPAA
jgi:hypothetical protein